MSFLKGNPFFSAAFLELLFSEMMMMEINRRWSWFSKAKSLHFQAASKVSPFPRN